MRNKPIQADQLIPTSSTPPSDAGFYRIDRHTVGVVGNMSFRDPDTQVVMPVGRGAIPFRGRSPRLLASLVASSTAACTSGVVTVTATAHGIIATAFNGFEFYYPGSPTLAAGWYSNFAMTDANTCTFSAPFAADFTSESINSGAALIDEITIASITLPANTLSPGDLVRAAMACNGDSVSSNKTIKFKLGSTTLCASAIATSSSTFVGQLTFSVVSANKQVGTSAREGSASATEYYGTSDISTALDLSLTGQLAAAGMYMGFSSMKLRID